MGPGRYRALAARRSPRPLVAPGRARQRGLGPKRLDLRRDLRGGIGARPDLAVRVPGRRAVLLLCRCPGGPAGKSVVQPSPGPGRPAGHGPVLCRHGGPAGLAGAGLLARPGPALDPAGHAHGDGPADGPDAPASVHLVLGSGLWPFRRRPRLGRELVCSSRFGGGWRRFPERTATARPGLRSSPARMCASAGWNGTGQRDWGWSASICAAAPGCRRQRCAIFTTCLPGFVAATTLKVSFWCLAQWEAPAI